MARPRALPFLGLCVCGLDKCPQFGFCHCGCKQNTPLSKFTNSKQGIFEGQPNKFILGHQGADRGGVVDTGEFKIDGKSCRLMPLSRGQYAIVDSCNYERFRDKKYYARMDPRSDKVYAVRSVRHGKTNEMVYMHREILGLMVGSVEQGDHKEPMATTLNTFDNLRILPSKTENDWNKRGWGKSGFKWAFYHRHSGLYHSVITINGVKYSLGYHLTAEKAHLKALALSKKLQGEYSRGDHRKKRK